MKQVDFCASFGYQSSIKTTKRIDTRDIQFNSFAARSIGSLHRNVTLVIWKEAILLSLRGCMQHQAQARTRLSRPEHKLRPRQTPPRDNHLRDSTLRGSQRKKWETVLVVSHLLERLIKPEDKTPRRGLFGPRHNLQHFRAQC